jgi:PAS domain S-box-containing protein
MESSDPLQDQLARASQELSRLKNELLDTRRYLHCILENSNDMVFATDADGILVSFSKGGEKVLGFTMEQVAGRHVKDLADDPLEFEKLLAISRKDGSAGRLEFPFQHKAGHTVYFDVSLVSLTDTDGQFAGTVGICRDITLWKKFQEDLIRIDRLAEIGRTASGIVHEINNPLAVIGEIAGWIEVVVGDVKGLNQEDRDELETAVKHIIKQVKRCRNITRQLLSYVRDSEPTQSSLDAHELLKETVSFLNPELKHKDIEVVVDFMEGPLLLHSDKQMLEQVFVNLISNAIYAVKEKGEKGGRIVLKTSRDESMLEIRISDNGTGISEENQKQMYDLFFTTKPSGKGTGLGLPICQNIIKKLGGGFSFETEIGKGTTFIVKLPVS